MASGDPKKRVQAAMMRPENCRCADCGAKDPRWASSTLDSWTDEQATLMETIGNKVSNDYWEARLPPNYPRPATEDLDGLGKFIRQKYELRKWVDPNRDPPNVAITKPHKHKHRHHQQGSDVSQPTVPHSYSDSQMAQHMNNNINNNFNPYAAPAAPIAAPSQPPLIPDFGAQPQPMAPSPQMDLLNLFSSPAPAPVAPVQSPVSGGNAFRPPPAPNAGNPAFQPPNRQTQFNPNFGSQQNFGNQQSFGNQNFSPYQNPNVGTNQQFGQSQDDRGALLNMLKAETSVQAKPDLHAQFGVTPSGRPPVGGPVYGGYGAPPQNNRVNVFRGGMPSQGQGIPRRSQSTDPFGKISPF